MTYTIRQLFSRPGHTIREFIEGKRVKHFSPVGLLLFIAGAYGVIAISSKLDLTPANEMSEELRTVAHVLNEWTTHHYAGTQLMILPLMSLASYLLFRKQGYHFFEHLVLNTFITIQKLTIGLCFLPLLIWKQGTEQIQTIINIQLLVGTVFACWAYSQFFQRIAKPKAWLLGFLTQVVLMLEAMLLLGIAVEVFSWFNWYKVI
jgi:hypothetical protein